MKDATLKMVIILFVFNVLLIVGFSMVGVNYKEKAVKEIEQVIAKEVVKNRNQAEYDRALALAFAETIIIEQKLDKSKITREAFDQEREAMEAEANQKLIDQVEEARQDKEDAELIVDTLEAIVAMQILVNEQGIELAQIMTPEPTENKYVLMAYDILIGYSIDEDELRLIELLSKVSDLAILEFS